MTREGERVRVRHFTGRIEVMKSGIFPMGRDHLDGSHFYMEMPPAFSSFYACGPQRNHVIYFNPHAGGLGSVFSALQVEAAISDQYNTVPFLTRHQCRKKGAYLIMRRTHNAKKRSWRITFV